MDAHLDVSVVSRRRLMSEEDLLCRRTSDVNPQTGIIHVQKSRPDLHNVAEKVVVTFRKRTSGTWHLDTYVE